MAASTMAAILGSLALLVFVALSIADETKRRKAVRKNIAESWGRVPQSIHKREELQSIASYFLNRKQEHKSGFAIDDITWNDLDMDDVFARLNSTGSTVGEETLYRLLREPVFDPDILKQRQDLIAFFHRNSVERTKIQLILARLGKKRFINVTDLIFDRDPPRLRNPITYKLLSALALVSPAFLLLDAGLGVLIILGSFLINLIVYYKARSEIQVDLVALGYLVRIVGCARRLRCVGTGPLQEISGRLTVCCGKIKGIEKRAYYLLFTGTGSLGDIVMDYIKIVLLKELIDYAYLRKLIADHREDLIDTYEIIGLIDSLIAVASYRESIPYHAVPWLETSSPSGPAYLEFEDLCHPLIDHPVSNSLRVNRPILITGSNASGKSTLLKAAAINGIFAQTICTCAARMYSSSIFAIFTSMALRDSVRDGDSYFIAELKSIKRILDYINDDIPCLCLVDEVLRGTNTIERIASSSQVLLHLANSNCICLAATHDIELTYILENCYQNVHFQETIIEDSIKFDYRLRSGRAASRNAIKLLRLMGYSEAIVREAERKAAWFSEHGRWEE
jgi:hypothetical protein